MPTPRYRRNMLRIRYVNFVRQIKEKIMSQESIIVTGAAGGVGSTAQTAIAILLEQGHHVRAMVRKLDEIGRASCRERV